MKQRLKIRFLDWLVNRYRIFDYNEQELKQVVKKLNRARYIEGYSSMIYELSKIIADKKVVVPRLKMIKGTSEKIFPHYQPVVQKAFELPLISEYGAAESGIIAFECPEGNMHINMEGVYVETDANDEIIITNLVARSFPIIRYKLGDIISLAPPDKKCECGLAHPIIEEVTGRIGKNIYGVKNKYPSLTLYYIFKNLYFNYDLQLNYQAHQDQKGYLDLWIKEDLNSDQHQLLMDQCRKYFKDDLNIKVLQRNDFRQTQGKLKDFISSVD